MRPLPSTIRIALPWVAPVLLTAACTAAGPAVPATTATPAPAASSTPTPPPRATASRPPASRPPASTSPAAAAPLTGLRSGNAGRSTVAVVLLTRTAGAPPTGLGAADVVLQEVTGSYSHLLALYQSRDESEVGPVAGTRPIDGKLLGVTRAIVANAGGSKGFVAVLDRFPIRDASPVRVSEGYRRTNGLYADTAALRRSAPSSWPASPPLFTFARTGDRPLSAKARAARELSVGGSAFPRVTWRRAGGRWVPGSGVMGVPMTNVIVQRVPFKSIQVHHPYGPFVPSAQPFGSGTCVAVSQAVGVECRWYKPGATKLTNYVGPDGKPLRLTPGTTWVLLVPSDAKVTVS